MSIFDFYIDKIKKNNYLLSKHVSNIANKMIVNNNHNFSFVYIQNKRQYIYTCCNFCNRKINLIYIITNKQSDYLLKQYNGCIVCITKFAKFHKNKNIEEILEIFNTSYKEKMQAFLKGTYIKNNSIIKLLPLDIIEMICEMVLSKDEDELKT
jgi:hypothetical protein